MDYKKLILVSGYAMFSFNFLGTCEIGYPVDFNTCNKKLWLSQCLHLLGLDPGILLFLQLAPGIFSYYRTVQYLIQTSNICE